MGELGLTHQVWCILLASRVHAERREEVMKYSRARAHTHTQHTGALSGFGEPGRHEELRRFSKVPLSTFCYVMGLFFSSSRTPTAPPVELGVFSSFSYFFARILTA